MSSSKLAGKDLDVKQPSVLEGQPCPVCKSNTLTLREAEVEVPFFGKLYLYSMDCSNCGFHKADVESAIQKPPVKIQFTVEGDKDLRVRVVKSSKARITLKGIGSIEPGIESNGYITNVEGLISRFKHQVQVILDSEDQDSDARAKAKKLLKKLNRILAGWDKAVLIIEDESGNSAILSEKAVTTRLKSSTKKAKASRKK